MRTMMGASRDVIAQRLHAIKAAIPFTTDAGVIAPHAVLVQTLVNQLRVTLEAIATFATAIAQRAQRHPDFPLFQALPGAGPVFASRLLTQRQEVLGALASSVSKIPAAHMRRVGRRIDPAFFLGAGLFPAAT
jgi:hypothetical protein